MKKFPAVATARQASPGLVSTRGLAQMVNMQSPVSLFRLIDSLKAPVNFHAGITTPSGTALGGTVDLSLFSDGTFSFNPGRDPRPILRLHREQLRLGQN